MIRRGRAKQGESWFYMKKVLFRDRSQQNFLGWGRVPPFPLKKEGSVKGGSLTYSRRADQRGERRRRKEIVSKPKKRLFDKEKVCSSPGGERGLMN